ncbi:hypothetical protein ACHWQZ_G003374 [Mnemiopsis leidyi]
MQGETRHPQRDPLQLDSATQAQHETTQFSRDVTQLSRDATQINSLKQKSVQISNRRMSTSTYQGSTTSEDTHVQSQLAYENTYQLEPYLHQQFSVKRIQDIIKAIFIQKLENIKYTSESFRLLSIQLSEQIKTQVKQELSFNNRYKIVVMVTMAPRQSQAIQIASRCMWYTPTDKFASWEFTADTFFAVGVVFGLYYE